MQLAKKDHNDYPLTHSQIDKIGNSIIFLSERIPLLFKTKVLKLLYIIEEVSVKKYGIPFYGVDFQLWRLGPVVRDVFVDLSSQTLLLGEYVDSKITDEGAIISAKSSFNDDEFSDCDMEILEKVVKAFKNHSAPELIDFTHRENFPWHAAAMQHGVLDDFKNNKLHSTDIVIDMSMLLDHNVELKDFYLKTLEFQRNSRFLKGHN